MSKKKKEMVIIDHTDPKDLQAVKHAWNSMLLDAYLKDRKERGYNELESLNTLQQAIDSGM